MLTTSLLLQEDLFGGFRRRCGSTRCHDVPQAICLTLRGFQAAKYCPTDCTLTLLAEGLQRQLLLFKPSEIATCLEVFSSFAFQPSQDIVDVSIAFCSPFSPLVKRCPESFLCT